jgi:phosphohistidine swiveling domain-containing protein
MLNNSVFYHGITRKCIIGFGRLFSNIFIDRKVADPVNGETVQRLHVPVSYAPKEKWLVRLDEDPSLENHTLTSLPRISFEIIAYTYDSLRKMNRMQYMKNDAASQDQNATGLIRTPVPYNIDMSVYIITKTQEDALQIIEQILPWFTPEYSMTINAVDEMGIRLDVPVVLNSVIVSDEFEGTFQQRRFVIHTINFQMKVSMFGPLQDQGVITSTTANIGQSKDPIVPVTTYNALGDLDTKTVTNESWIDEL